MRRWIYLYIVFALIFAGGLMLAFELVTEAVLLFIVGSLLGYILNRCKLLPE
jgi:hypothetical protein